MRPLKFFAFGLLVTALIAGCGKIKHSDNNVIYMPDMVYSPAFKAQEGQMRVPPKGTIPRGFKPYPAEYLINEEASVRNQNPLPRTRQVLLRGQDRFNTYCIVCHGPAGEGDGSVVPQFPRPPSLQSAKVRGWADGRIFHVVTMGQNLMPSYAAQVDVKDRWAIIHYIRALQRSKNPSAEDLKFSEAGN